MSHTASRAVFRHSRSKGSTRLVLLAMADEASDSGELTAYRRSHSHLARKANVDEGTVRRAIRDAVGLGELVVKRQGTGRDSSDYQLVLPDLDAIEGVQVAPPAPAARTPRARNLHPQGGPDAPPIIPLVPTAPVVAQLPGPTFDDFYRAFPLHTGVGAARRAWAKAAAKADPATIVAGAERYRDDPNRMAEYTAHPATWLNAERWADDPLPPRAQQRGQRQPVAIDTDRDAPGGVLAL